MKSINLIIMFLSIIMAFQFCNKVHTTKEGKPVQPIHTKKIMIENPENGEPVEVEVEYIEGRYILGGDMIVEPYVMEAVGMKKPWRWPNGVIPYKIRKDHPLTNRIKDAIRTINANTKLCFRPRSNEDDYVVIDSTSDNRCWAVIGKVRFIKNEVILGRNCSTGSIIHELLHTAGLFHEQQRSDRNKYVYIHWDNIQDSWRARANFWKMPFISKDIHDYDYGSIMHYPAFTNDMSIAVDINQPIITPKRPNVNIGQRDSLSSGDIAGINAMYYDASDYNCGPEPPQDDAVFISQNVPLNVNLYDPFEVSLTFRNTGPTTWNPGYKLVSLSPGWLISEVPLNQTVLPDNEVTINFSLNALSVGIYNFQWKLSRPFGGSFGDPSIKVNVEVDGGLNTNSCTALDEQLRTANARLKQWQDLLYSVPPQAKGDIINQIKSIKGEISALRRKKSELGCS